MCPTFSNDIRTIESRLSLILIKPDFSQNKIYKDLILLEVWGEKIMIYYIFISNTAYLVSPNTF